jgi:purine-nucleoside phosphorylase
MKSLREELDRTIRSIESKDPRCKGGDFVAAVLGSGLGGAVDAMENVRRVPYSEIDGLLAPSVSGHAGALCIGTLEGATVLVLSGRLHPYEGHELRDVVRAVRALVRMGARALLLSNAAGGIRKDLRVGDLMLIRDHINLTGKNPLVGPQEEGMGLRFPDMTRAWDPNLRESLHRAGKSAKIKLKEGVYAGVLGPSYETPAEIRMLAALGADAVGMSTVHEAIAACHLGGRVCGFSIITNAAAGTGGPDQSLDHSDVHEAAGEASARVQRLLRAWVADRASWWETGS